ncbi:MAG: hypothetical protein HY909_24715 [Deltaproteobacteria bacterium]|nr:hypothetical protein [Deltaproteobacteria bacterium]
MSQGLFRNRRTLAILNVAAVGLALAATTAAAFRALLSGQEIVWVTAAPTLVLGTLWAALLRWRRTVGRSTFRVAWLFSIPLAMVNAAVAGGLLFLSEPGRADRLMNFLMGMVLGATFGAIFWVPALLVTLVCFGLPIAHGQRLAKQGLAGGERGEQWVGVMSAVMALVAVGLSLYHPDWSNRGGQDALWALRALAGLGGASGLLAALLAGRREALRRAFVADVEAGKVEHFRVDATPEGKALVRVVSVAEHYRVADFTEEVAAMDREGAVVRHREEP